jgi:CRISPR-associated exonuclease Cas4
MVSAIAISTLNDFIFCPKSLYLHSIYGSFNTQTYHDTPQINGTIAHQTIDEKRYTTSKQIIMSLPIYSSKYNLIGKIDIYDKLQKCLIERKYHLKKIYDGHYMQLWAQYICLKEMGYQVNCLKIYSMKDNKTHKIDLPNAQDLKKLENLIEQIKQYKPTRYEKQYISPNKCSHCIYRTLCDRYEGNTT